MGSEKNEKNKIMVPEGIGQKIDSRSILVLRYVCITVSSNHYY